MPKTYKDKAGNIRQYGTGRIIKAAAPKPAVKPKPSKVKTFTDAQGVLRRVGGLAVNPLDREVDANIRLETGAYDTAIGQSNAALAAENEKINQIDTGFRASANADNAAAQGHQAALLSNAATGAAGSQDAIRERLDWLKGIIGDVPGLDAGGLAAGAAGASAEGTGMLGANYAAGDRAFRGLMDGSRLETRNALSDNVRFNAAQLAEYRGKIATAKATRAKTRAELERQKLDMALGRQELRLNQAGFDREGEQFDQTLAAQAAGDGGSGGSGSGSGDKAETFSWGTVKLPTKQAEAVQGNIDAWRLKKNGKTLASFLSYIRRGGAGVNGTQAARIAMHVFGPADMRRFAPTRASFEAAMRNAGVNASVIRAWATKVYGLTELGPNGQRPASHSEHGTHVPAAPTAGGGGGDIAATPGLIEIAQPAR